MVKFSWLEFVITFIIMLFVHYLVANLIGLDWKLLIAGTFMTNLVISYLLVLHGILFNETPKDS